MIRVDSLRKEYGGFVAVEESSFIVEPGEVFGIVGPNGAGKTTTLKAIAGLLEQTSGLVEIEGTPSTEASTRHRLGFLPEESPLYEE
ncbi:MAG: ATP-binding cassette domain-containing protein, partial [Natronomonas sp.]